MELFGKNIKNSHVAIAGGGLVVAFLFYRHYSSSSTSGGGSGNSANATDPVTGLPYSEDNQIDPVTGLTYLSEAQQYGSVQAAEQMVTSGSAWYGTSAAGSGTTAGYPTGGYYGGGSTTSTGNAYTTNAQWAQAVQAGLVGVGYNSTDIAAALGLFFAQQPLPANYAQIVQAAEAEYGPPPQGTYSIIPEPSSGGSTGGTGGTGGGTKPASAPSGLHAVARYTQADLSWHAVTHATEYRIRVWDSTGKVIHDSRTISTHLTIGNLAQRHHYGWHVQALDSAGGGPWSGNSHFTTE